MKFFDRVRVATTTLGQATLSFGAATSPNMLTPAEAGAAEGDETAYVIEEGADFEVGRGVIGAGAATMTRATVLRSKIGGVAGVAKMSLTGNAKVRLIQSAGDINDVIAALSGKAEQIVVDTALSAVNAGLANRVRVDAVQSFSPTEAAQARTNIGAQIAGNYQPAGDYQPSLGFAPLNKAGDTMTGPLSFAGATGVWDISQTAIVSLADNAGFNFGLGAGIVIASEAQFTGSTAVFAVGGGGVLLLGQSATSWSTSPGANLHMVFGPYGPGGSDVYRIGNGTGGTRIIGILALRARGAN